MHGTRRVKFILDVTKFLYAKSEIFEEPFVKTAIEKNLQVAAPEINIKGKELVLLTLPLRTISSPGNYLKFLFQMLVQIRIRKYKPITYLSKNFENDCFASSKIRLYYVSLLKNREKRQFYDTMILMKQMVLTT